MNIIYKKMNVGKSVEMFNDMQKENILVIVYNAFIPILNAYLWSEEDKEDILEHFDEAILSYSGGSKPTLLLYTNDTQNINQWLFDLVEKCPYISDAIIYCKED